MSERQLVIMRTMVNCFHNDTNAHVIIRPCFDNDMCALYCFVSLCGYGVIRLVIRGVIRAVRADI